MDKHLQEKICKYTIAEFVKEFVNSNE